MKKITLLFFLYLPTIANAQIEGTISDAENNPLSFVSVYLEKTITGTTSNDHGDYILDVSKTGNYTLVFQFLGFKTLKKQVVVTDFPFALNVQMEEEKIVLDEIYISSKENPANLIIKNAISNKERNTDKLLNYTAKFYSRGLYRIKNAPESFLGQSVGDLGGGLDSTRSGIIYLSETISEISFQKKPKNFKEKIIASKVSGTDNGISFNRAQDVNFNFYEDNVTLGNDLVSPISKVAFSYYKFKLEGSFYDKNGKLINKISILPKRVNDRVFKGFIYITENDWAIYGIDVTVNGAQVNIPAVDVLRLKQSFNYSETNDVWVLISQAIEFKVGFLGFNLDGKFSSGYSNYDFSPQFTKKTFTQEVLSFAKEATRKDTVYWSTLRPVPLTTEETSDYKIKGRIKELRKSKKYLDSLDTKENKIKLLSPIMGYTYKNSYKDWTFSFDSPIDDIRFNTVQGLHSKIGFNYFKRENDKGKWWNVGANLAYGFSEKKIRPTLYFFKKWNNFSRPVLGISAGIETAQFNDRNPISSITNATYSLLARKNYLKIYEKTFAQINYAEELFNGFYLGTSLSFADRKPLFNTSSYSFVSRDYSYTSNNPLDENSLLAPFTRHQIWTLKLGARIVFGQKYLSYPNEKSAIKNDRYPTLLLSYRNNFGAADSQLNSTLFMARLLQDINLGNVGNFKYNIRTGLFLKKKEIAFMDYLHPNGNQTLRASGNRTDSFGLLPYYTFSTNDRYAEMHAEHNFKGFLLNKIPLINQLNFHLVGGAKALFTAHKKPYTEYSVGLANLGIGKWRFLRVDYVRSNYNGIMKDGFLFGITLFD
jgi:hypothetical protein